MDQSTKDIIDAMELAITHEGRPYKTWSIGLLGLHTHNQRDKVGPTVVPTYNCSPEKAKIIFDHFVRHGVVPLGEYQPECQGVFLHR